MGSSLPWVYVHSSICENLLGVMVLHRSMHQLEEEGPSARGICAICYM